MSCEQLAAAAETRLRGARATGQVSREHVPAAKPRSWKTTGKRLVAGEEQGRETQDVHWPAVPPFSGSRFQGANRKITSQTGTA